MIRQAIVFCLLLGALIGTGLVYWWYPHVLLERLIWTFLWTLIVYVLHEFVQRVITTQIQDLRSRYTLHKTVSLVSVVIGGLLVLTLWVENIQTLVVAYGLVAAGVAIALQDLFRNVAGGIIVLLSPSYRVGDRIEIDDKAGDVIDIGLFYTVLMEMKEWVAGDQATGRLTVIPNGRILNSVVHNYTRDHEFIWDELAIPITYDSDWKAAYEHMRSIAKKITKDVAKEASKNIAKMQKKYYLAARDTEPTVFVRMTDNWIELTLRYMTDVRKRRPLYTRLQEDILSAFEKAKNITIASATYEIVGIPELKLKK